jgi:hypothetical protein
LVPGNLARMASTGSGGPACRLAAERTAYTEVPEPDITTPDRPAEGDGGENGGNGGGKRW